jgi:hypothetical protein
MERDICDTSVLKVVSLSLSKAGCNNETGFDKLNLTAS